METSSTVTRKRSASPATTWGRTVKDSRITQAQQSPRQGDHRIQKDAARRGDFSQNQLLYNQMQEAEQMRAWVAQEDEFVLEQSKKKAKIRVREGRARPIDWLAVTMGATEAPRGFADEEEEEEQEEGNREIDIMDPSSYIETLEPSQLQDLDKDIDTYLALEKSRSSRQYWNVRCPLQCHILHAHPFKGPQIDLQAS